MHRPNRMRPREKSKDPVKTLKRLLSYFNKGYKLKFAVVLICIIMTTLASVGASLFLQTLIDDYVTPLLSQTNPSFSGLWNVLKTMACLYLAGIFSAWLYNFIMVGISQGIMKKIRDDMFSHMQTLPIKYFDTHTYGDVMSRYTNDTDTLRQMLSQSIPQMFSSAISIVTVFCAMVSISIPLTVLVLLVVAFMMLITKKIGGKSANFFMRQQKALGAVNGFIEETINGQKVVKVFTHEEETKEHFYKINDELCNDATEANKYANILMPIMGNLGNLLYVLIALVGGLLSVSNIPAVTLTVGAVSSFLMLSKSFTMPVNQISQQLNSIIMALAGAERIFELMDEEPEADDGYVTLVNAKEVNGKLTECEERTDTWAWKHPHGDGTVTYTRLMGDVRFYDVDFGYTDDKIVLHNIDLYAQPGEKVAFVGATGAGKTTITNLINRFYVLADGKIRYDGININKIKKSDLRRSLGVVLQDVNLFTGTVMENIRYGKRGATDEEVYAAARLANADGFINMLPDGYDTLLTGDGSGLSQGQRQLISIARAAIADPPVMILDEATSSIDTRTEAIVQKGMDSLMKGRTVFVIAHRLSTVRNSDVIMVLDHGRIIERGNHDELIAQKGHYYSLYTGAFELD